MQTTRDVCNADSRHPHIQNPQPVSLNLTSEALRTVEHGDVVLLGCDARGRLGRYQRFGETYYVHLQG
jgi:hypothetical protein